MVKLFNSLIPCINHASELVYPSCSIDFVFLVAGKLIEIEQQSSLHNTMRPGWEDLVRRCMQMFLNRSDGQPWSYKRHYQDGMSHFFYKGYETFRRVFTWWGFRPWDFFCYVFFRLELSLVFSASAFHTGRAETPLYRFSLSDGTLVTAQTRTDLCRNPSTNEPHSFLSTHFLQRCKCLDSYLGLSHVSDLSYCTVKLENVSSLSFCQLCVFCREHNSYRGNPSGAMRPQNMGVNHPNQQMSMGQGGSMSMNRGYGIPDQGNMPQRGMASYSGGGRMNQMNHMNPMHQMNNMGQMNPMHPMNHMGSMNQMGHHGMHQQHTHTQMGQMHGGPGGGGFGMGMTSPPQSSPGINGPPHNVLGSPRVRGSPKTGASPFSPGGKSFKKSI